MKVVIVFNKTFEAEKLYICSDLHINHTNIVRCLSSWPDKSGCRNFNSLSEMENAIIDNINNIVPSDGILINLGDIIFGDKTLLKSILGKINCKTHHLVFGNHDHWMLNKPETLSLFTSTQHYSEINLFYNNKKYRIILSHYPLASWNDMSRNSIMLFGHCHGTYKSYGKSMDVGIDCNDFKPVKFSEILAKTENKEIVCVDHHVKNVVFSS